MSDPKFSQPDNLEDLTFENNLRPGHLKEFIGQKKKIDNLRTYIQGAIKRGEALDHVLFHGPPGLGKTTLANIIASEMGVQIKQTSGPILDKKGDITALLTDMERFDVLFIDEIHRLKTSVEEILYKAMEDFQIDVIIGEGMGAKTVPITLSPFTLIGATTRTGLLSSPLRDRFGIFIHLDFYSLPELVEVIHRSARILEISISGDAAEEIARRSRGTPRIANKLLRRVRDFAQVKGEGVINTEIADRSFAALEVDEVGFDEIDRKILYTIIEKFSGGPVGISTLSTSIQEEKETIEDVYEPYLVQQGFLKLTSRGRMATPKAYTHLKLKVTDEQKTLFKDK
jgi:Holliday junction DNA helicase RuvB